MLQIHGTLDSFHGLQSEKILGLPNGDKLSSRWSSDCIRIAVQALGNELKSYFNEESPTYPDTLLKIPSILLGFFINRL